MSVVLDLQPDTSYEPSEAEMMEYGKWLGMELPQDMPLLWIAREGLKAPLPENWKACKSEKGELYYFNFKSGQSIWDHPSDEHYRELLKTEKAKLGAKSKDIVEKDAALSAPPQMPNELSSKITKKKRSKASESENRKDGAKQQDAASKSGSLKELQPIQQKKDLPRSLRLSVLPADAKGKGALSPARRSSSPEPRSTASHSDSSLALDNAKTAKADEPDIVPLPAKVVAGGGVNGLRAMDKLSSISTDRRGSQSAERSKVDQQFDQELKEYKLQKENSLRARKEDIDAKIEEELRQYRENVSAEKQKQRLSIDSEAEEAAKAETAKLTAETETKLAQLRQEYEAKRAAESERLRSKLKSQLEHDRRKVEAEFAQILETFTREKRQESEIRKEAQTQVLQEVGKSVADVRQCSSAFVREYETALRDFSEAVQRSQTIFAETGARKQQQLQVDMDAKLAEARREFEKEIDEQKERHHKNLDSVRKSHESELEELKERQRQELHKMRDDFEEQRSLNQREQLSKEHARFMETLSEIKETQSKELEALKQQLKEKAQEELNAIMQDLDKERHSYRSSLGAVPLSEDNEPSPCLPESGSPSGTDDDDEAQKRKASPPHLDGKLLAGTLTEENAEAVTFGGPPPLDIKAVVTEALREVFMGSPFILPSPALSGDRRATPETPAGAASTAVIASQAGTDPRSANATANIATSSLNNGSSPSKSTSGFKLPLSFQEQRSLVESERRRLQEGRRYVELQEQALEERRQQLKHRRHQWKQDVLVAKREGIRSSSKRGQFLNNVRLTLEEQAQGLEHDMMILRDSQVWLLSKEQRLMILERQIEEQEQLRGRNGGDSLVANHWNLDTAALMTGGFKPRRYSSATPSLALHRDVMGFGEVGASGSGTVSLEAFSSSPVLSKALSRIERRLDEVTSIIHQQHQQAAILAATPSMGHGGSRRHSLASPANREYAQGFVRRTSLGHSKSEAPRWENHLDQ